MSVLQMVCSHEALSWRDCSEHLETECFVATCEGCGCVSFDCGEEFV
jgi:hypothetical protein